MWIDVEKSIRSVLNTIELLNPIFVRFVINRNAGHTEDEDMRLFSTGKRNTALMDVDTKFYGIMRSQKTLKIPSIMQSSLLSNLSIGEATALFYPLNTRYGYCGFVWACFSPDQFSEKIEDAFIGCCGWAEVTLKTWLEDELQVSLLANNYVNLLEYLRIPALVLVKPDHILFSNPAFERLANKEDILTRLRENVSVDDSASTLRRNLDCTSFHVKITEENEGDVLLFPQAGDNVREIRFGQNEIEYFRLLSSKVSGDLSMIDSSGELSSLQKNYIVKTKSRLERLDQLFSYGSKHYKRNENSSLSFEIVSIMDITRDVIFDLAAVARLKRLEIELLPDNNKSIKSSGSAVGDPWLLTLAIFNLINNAITFSTMDGKPIRVAIHFDDNEWQLSVEDSGTGISPLDLEKLREQSYKEVSEAGLHGIALVKYVASAHKGKLLIDSTLGTGSKFTLQIPYY